MPRFRKKPVEIEAEQYTGIYDDRIKSFVTCQHEFVPTEGIKIATLEGVMTAKPYDWIVRGIKGEFYPVAPDIFEATYDRVEGMVETKVVC